MFQNIHNWHSKQKYETWKKETSKQANVAGTNTNTGAAEAMQHQI